MNITIEGREHEQFREDIANLIMDALKEDVDYIVKITREYQGGYMIHYMKDNTMYAYYDVYNKIAQKIEQHIKIEEINNKIIRIFK